MSGDQISAKAAMLAAYLHDLASIPLVPTVVAVPIQAASTALLALSQNADECNAIAVDEEAIGPAFETAFEKLVGWLKSRNYVEGVRALIAYA